MFDAGEAQVLFYSQETGECYDVPCSRYMDKADCKVVRTLADSTADRLHVLVFVSRFQELHNSFDYERGLLDAERSGAILKLFECLRSVGISAYVNGLSWG